MNIASTLKQHPYAVGGVAFGGLVLLFILMRASGGAAGGSNDAAALQTIAAANAQQSQLAAQVGTAQTAAQSTNYQTSLAAQVQNNQAIAAQQAQNYQTSAALIAALAQNQTAQQTTAANLSAYGIEADVTNHQTTAALKAAENTNATNLAAYTSQVGYATTLAQIQGQLTSQGIAAQTTVATQANQNQFDLDNQIVSTVQAAGLNHGTSSLEQSLTAILSGVMGQPQIGVAAENASAVAAASSASMWSNIMNSLTNLGGKITGGLLAPVTTGSQSVLNQLLG